MIPDAGQGKDLVGRRTHEIGVFAGALAAPLIEPTCRDDAATVAYRPPEGGLGLDPSARALMSRCLVEDSLDHDDTSPQRSSAHSGRPVSGEERITRMSWVGAMLYRSNGGGSGNCRDS